LQATTQHLHPMHARMSTWKRYCSPGRSGRTGMRGDESAGRRFSSGTITGTSVWRVRGVKRASVTPSSAARFNRGNDTRYTSRCGDLMHPAGRLRSRRRHSRFTARNAPNRSMSSRSMATRLLRAPSGSTFLEETCERRSSYWAATAIVDKSPAIRPPRAVDPRVDLSPACRDCAHFSIPARAHSRWRPNCGDPYSVQQIWRELKPASITTRWCAGASIAERSRRSTSSLGETASRTRTRNAACSTHGQRTGSDWSPLCRAPRARPAAVRPWHRIGHVASLRSKAGL